MQVIDVGIIITYAYVYTEYVTFTKRKNVHTYLYII
jgi:hypothetical protein